MTEVILASLNHLFNKNYDPNQKIHKHQKNVFDSGLNQIDCFNIKKARHPQVENITLNREQKIAMLFTDINIASQYPVARPSSFLYLEVQNVNTSSFLSAFIRNLLTGNTGFRLKT